MDALPRCRCHSCRDWRLRIRRQFVDDGQVIVRGLVRGAREVRLRVEKDRLSRGVESSPSFDWGGLEEGSWGVVELGEVFPAVFGAEPIERTTPIAKPRL
jgi:hypothetical protein